MNVDLAHELLNELGSSLERLEAQHAAVLQFLKDAGVVTDDKLAPYLAQAGISSDVRWRAVRVRLERLISTQQQREEQLAEKERHQAGAAQASVQNQGKEASSKNDEGSHEAAPQRETAVANTPAENTGVQSVSKKDSEHDERAASGEEKTGAKPETKGA
jgi:hypothetical protein